MPVIAKAKATLVFIPFPILSHQAAAIQMANLLVDRDERLSATIIVMRLPVDTKTGSQSNNNPRIKFVELPRDDANFAKWGNSPNTFLINFIDSQKVPVQEAVANITTPSCNIVGFIVDMLCTTMIDVANELGIPSYMFYTCGAATLGLFLHLQGLSDEQNRDLSEYEKADAAIPIPTYVNPVPAKVWSSIVFEKDSPFPNFARRFRETKGIIMNTFLELEPHAIKSLSDDEKLPRVYPVGPIIETGSDHNDNHQKQDYEIIEWLNEQPDSSVVFICFGSRGSFEKDQVNEIAVGLENSGQRFIWSLQKPAPKDNLGFPVEYENHGDVLPGGFLERTVRVGKVIGWAPQMAILSHPAVGGFVSHCGWNSTLESVWCDVPVAVWPLGGEQQANAFQLIKELEMGVEIKMDYRKGCDVIVKTEKIEKVIRELMGPENEGRRAKVKVLNEKSRVVMEEGGSSYEFLGRFVDDVFNNIC